MKIKITHIVLDYDDVKRCIGQTGFVETNRS